MRFDTLTFLLGAASSKIVEINTEPIEQELDYFEDWINQQVDQVTDEEWMSMHEDAQKMDARLQIEMMDLIDPMADALDAIAEATDNEFCDGEALYQCLAADGRNHPDIYQTDCAVQNGCEWNFLTLSPEEQQELQQEYMQALGELQWEHDDLMRKVNDDIRATIERHNALLERTRNNIE